jgi:CBS domain containing-hemolysin-like protein
MFNDIFLLIVLILLTAFFSGAEIAFITGNKLKIEIRARKNNFAAKSALYFTNNPQKFFSTILIGVDVVSVSFASLSAIFLAHVFGYGEIKILIISTFILLLFGELLPKYLAREVADRFQPFPYGYFLFCFTPL